ncbi:THUMP domain-containing protein 1 [Saguinus oedipus]|uniref:THUMP domain-containing protein 1 n=1 Tax=Saguinus oedipus TaxID=9490 RepID=A0ABQ9ULG9_SAGOE|nr:THUMP domain-containing protein 1 [Saguinus oedipus]
MAAPAQQPTQPGGGKRKGKAQYVLAKRARRCDAGGPHQLEPGLQGILITCNMNERKCVEEAYSLLNEYGDDMYGPEKVPVLGLVGLLAGLAGGGRAGGLAAGLGLPALGSRRNCCRGVA